MYTPDLVRLIEHHRLSPHLVTDDTQVCRCFSPNRMNDLAAWTSACTDDVLSWMRSNRIQLNTHNTKLIWCAISRPLHRLQSASIKAWSETILPSTTVRELGVYINSDLSMRSHGLWMVVALRAALLHFGRSAKFGGHCHPLRLRLVVSLVLTQLDYSNAMPAGIPSNLLHHLHAVLNTFARTITCLPHSAHITTSFAGLHWVRAA